MLIIYKLSAYKKEKISGKISKSLQWLEHDGHSKSMI